MTAIDCLLRDIEEEKKQARIIGLEEGRTEGIEKGKAEGRAEGRAEGIIEATRNTAMNIAKEMLKVGMDIETISKITKLDTKEISNIEYRE